jgi:hypothetical protein
MNQLHDKEKTKIPGSANEGMKHADTQKQNDWVKQSE